jgi:hypothetical protein
VHLKHSAVETYVGLTMIAMIRDISAEVIEKPKTNM